MKFVPRRAQVVGRIVIKKREQSLIVRPDETRNITKFVLIDALGPDAEAAGLKVGDIVLPFQIENVVLEGGASFRPLIDEKQVRLLVKDLALEDVMVQTDSAAGFVPWGSKEAAQSIGGAA